MYSKLKNDHMLPGSVLRLAVVAVAFAFLLAACGGNDPGEQYVPEAPIEVTFGTDPATPHPAGEPLTMYVDVMQEGVAVEDAEEAVFEVWQDDGEDEEADHEHGEHEHHDMEGYES